MKRTLLYAALLCIGFLLAGWFLFGPFMVGAIKYYRSTNATIFFANSDMEDMFWMQARQALSWGVLPWFAFFSCWSLARFKGMAFAAGPYFKALGMIILGYVLGAGTRLFWLGTILGTDYKLPEDIKNYVPFSVLEIYKWGLMGAVLFSLLHFTVIKPQKVSLA